MALSNFLLKDISQAYETIEEQIVKERHDAWPEFSKEVFNTLVELDNFKQLKAILAYKKSDDIEIFKFVEQNQRINMLTGQVFISAEWGYAVTIQYAQRGGGGETRIISALKNMDGIYMTGAGYASDEGLMEWEFDGDSKELENFVNDAIQAALAPVLKEEIATARSD